MTDNWDVLLAEIRSDLKDVVSLQESEEPAGPVMHAELLPISDVGFPMTLLGLKEEVLLCYGDGRARWELDWSEQSKQLIKDIARAVCTVHYRVTEAPGRIFVEVFLADGSTETTTTHEFPSGLLPKPGWKRHGNQS